MLRRRELSVKGNTAVLKRGGLLYSFHFGVWELMPHTLRRLGFRLGIITNRYGDDNRSPLGRLIDNFLFRFRSHGGIKIFYHEDTLKIIRFLKSGGILGMLVDGNTLYQKFDKAKRLARVCKVPLVPFAAYREGEAGVLDIGCNLTDLIQKRHLDYIWFYKSREKF